MTQRMKCAGRFVMILLVCPFAGFEVSGQISAEKLERFLADEARIETSALQFPLEVKHFYKKLQHRLVWQENSASRNFLFSLLKQSADYGLKENDYQPDRVQSINTYGLQLRRLEDSIIAEVQLTDALIHFLHDVVYGNSPVVPGYNGLNYIPACFDIPSSLADAVTKNNLPALLTNFEQNSPEYDSLKQLIKAYNKILTSNGFSESRVTSAIVSITNKPLMLNLFHLGFLDSATQKISEKELRARVKAAQRSFNLLVDGVLRSTALEALNAPLANRLSELNSAINTVRWLNCIKLSQKIIVVNIPSATLLVYDNGHVILESRIIVGKRSTPTPTLSSKITEVILYPYWMAPYSIATKELLPAIKRNIGFLDANGYQVINNQGKVIDPYKINWQALSTSNFPYIIRESTGCDNALGLVKLNFYNPYSVYLHDTPDKSLFSFNKRYFSHGCMRVEKAMDLARLVLKNNNIAIDTLEAKGCLYNQKPITVLADEIIPVFVLYNTAWIDSTGRVTFSEDIYRKNQFNRQEN